MLIRPLRGSLEVDGGVKMPYAMVDVLEEASRMLKERGGLTEECNDAIAQHYHAIARSLWRFGRREDSLKIAKIAYEKKPTLFDGCYGSQLAEHLARLVGFTNYERLHGMQQKLRGSV